MFMQKPYIELLKYNIAQFLFSFHNLILEIKQMITKASIQKLVSTNRLDQALKHLLEGLPEEYKNDAILLNSRLSSLNRSVSMGTITYDQANISRAQITITILSLADNLDGNTSNSLGGTSSNPTIQQTHFGSGDNIGGDKIDRQINIKNGNYIENQNIDSDSNSSTNKNTKRILFTAANPSDEARLQIGVEHRTIKEEMQKGSRRDDFTFLPVQLAARIQEIMRSFVDKPNIIHFSGHGIQEGILISSDNNEGVLLGEGALKRLFKPIKDTTECVILNSCHSSNQAKSISKFGIIVIGHNLPIADSVAIAFSMGFYLGLSEGKTYEDAYNDGIIAVMAKNQKFADVVEVWKDGEKLDW